MNAQVSPIISLLIFSKLPSLKGDTSSFIYSSVVFNNCGKQVLRCTEHCFLLRFCQQLICYVAGCCSRVWGQAVIKPWSCSLRVGKKHREAASRDWWSGLQLTITCQAKTAQKLYFELSKWARLEVPQNCDELR